MIIASLIGWTLIYFLAMAKAYHADNSDWIDVIMITAAYIVISAAIIAQVLGWIS